ncbi:hypothetical protein ACPPVO_23565 [Dactylosporangium sp. McL0621]|uniref:hypothetical protein n=1 Tax=Dactylosporangium sp. McL0621 TaxID=3415678 RepID=UPI003CFA1E04
MPFRVPPPNAHRCSTSLPLRELTKTRRRRWRYTWGLPEDAYDQLVAAAQRTEALALDLIEAGTAWHSTGNPHLAAPLPGIEVAGHQAEVEAEIAAMQSPMFNVEALFEAHRQFSTVYNSRAAYGEYTVRSLPMPMRDVLNHIPHTAKTATPAADAQDAPEQPPTADHHLEDAARPA